MCSRNTRDSPNVAFNHAIIETPDHTRTLVRDLTLRVGKDSNASLVVRGPSGAGKSSILKVLGGLWPCDGTLERPSKIGRDGILFLPQQNYTTMGSLRAQAMDPDTEQPATPCPPTQQPPCTCGAGDVP